MKLFWSIPAQPIGGAVDGAPDHQLFTIEDGVFHSSGNLRSMAVRRFAQRERACATKAAGRMRYQPSPL